MRLKAKVLGKIHLHNKNKFSPEKKKKRMGIDPNGSCPKKEKEKNGNLLK